MQINKSWLPFTFCNIDHPPHKINLFRFSEITQLPEQYDLITPKVSYNLQSKDQQILTRQLLMEFPLTFFEILLFMEQPISPELLTQMREKDRTIRQMEIDRAVQEQKLNFVTLELKELRSKFDQIHNWDKFLEGVYEAENLNTSLNQCRIEKGELKTELDCAHIKLHGLTQRNQELEQELSITRNNLQKLESKMATYADQYQNEMETMIGSIEDLKSEIQKQGKLIEEYKLDQQKKVQEIEHWKSQHIELKVRLNEDELQYDRLAKEHHQLVNENKNLQANIFQERQQYVKKIENLKQLLKESEMTFNKEFIQFQQQTHHKDDIVKQQSQSFKEVQRSYRDLAEQYNQITLELEKTKQAEFQSQKENSELKNKLQTVQKEKQEIQDFMTQLSHQYESKFEERMIYYESEIKNYKIQLQEKDKVWEQRIEQLEAQIKTQQLQITQDTSEIKIKILQDTIDRLKKRESDLLASVEGEKQNYQLKVEQNDRERQILVETVMKLQQQLKDMESASSTKSTEMDELRAKIHLLNFQCEDKNKVIEEHLTKQEYNKYPQQVTSFDRFSQGRLFIEQFGNIQFEGE